MFYLGSINVFYLKVIIERQMGQNIYDDEKFFDEHGKLDGDGVFEGGGLWGHGGIEVKGIKDGRVIVSWV